MTNTYTTTIKIPPHAMGHVIGKHGSIIKRIRDECNVTTRNPPYSEYQDNDIMMTIYGYSRNAIQQAIFQIDHQIAISNAWCKNNNMNQNMDLKSAVQFILNIEKIKTMQDLDVWCGDMGKDKIYSYVKRLSFDHWCAIKNPKNSVRFYYQKMLSGYKICKK